MVVLSIQTTSNTRLLNSISGVLDLLRALVNNVLLELRAALVLESFELFEVCCTAVIVRMLTSELVG